MKDKIRGALIGLAIGDALGATTEFMKQSQVKKEYDYLNEIIGGGWLNLKAGEVTDDTEMTICVADGIIKNYKDPIEEIGKEFLKWHKSVPKDVGIITNTTINIYKKNWFEAAKEAHDLVGQSGGNGSLMRCLPIALAYKDVNVIRNLSAKQSLMTHYDNRASEACMIYNLIAFDVLNGESLKTSIKKHIRNTDYELIVNNNPQCLPGGFVVDTFMWVLRVLLTSNSFSEVVETLVNMGEDSDTTAAIAGGLAGLECGYEKIDNKYKDKIILENDILKIADELLDVRSR